MQSNRNNKLIMLIAGHRCLSKLRTQLFSSIRCINDFFSQMSSTHTLGNMSYKDEGRLCSGFNFGFGSQDI